MKSFFLINHRGKKPLLKKKKKYIYIYITLLTSLTNQRLHLQIAAHIIGQHLQDRKSVV